MPQNPFKFLDSYTKEDRDIFFGRDREIEEMYQKVFESKILLVYGISGTGKTSLINCGLANKFEDSDWLPVNVRRGRNILDSLERELGKVALTTIKTPSPPNSRGYSPLAGGELPVRVVKVLQSIYLDHFKPIYLIFDQLEELFIFGDREEREEFIQIVKAVVDSDVQCRFIFSIREEYLAGVTEFEAVIPDFLTNRMRIEKMTSKNAIQVIEGPCKVQNIEVEEGFPQALLQKLNPDSNEVELTYLQVFLDKIYRLSTMNYSAEGTNDDSPLKRGAKGGVFTIPLLDQVGDVSDLLGSFLEEQISDLDDPGTGLTILKSFVSIKGTKRQITEEEIIDFSRTLGKPVDKETLTGLIQQFINLRILRDKDESGRYELRHDSLAAKIYEKITLVEKEILEVRQFIENAYNNYLQRKLLLSQEDLNYLAPYEDKLFLSKTLQEFVNASKADYLAKRRAFRRITSISTAGFILIAIAIGYYYIMKSQGAKTKDLLITAALQEKSSPALSLETAFLAYEADTNYSISKKAVMDAFYTMYEQHPDAQKRIFDFSPYSTQVMSARFSEDGNYISGWLENNQVKVWNNRGLEIFTTLADSSTILNVLLSTDNEYIGILLNSEKIKVYSLKSTFLFEVNTTINMINNKYLFDFTGRKEFILAVANENVVYLYDGKGNLFQKLGDHNNKINALDISPDERFIATASSDKKVNIWYYDHSIDQFSLYDSITGHRDMIRSCLFNNSSDYILTSSDDSTVGIWNLIGERIELFTLNYTIKPQMPWIFEYDYMQFIEGKECDAVFSKDQKSITVTVYNETNSGHPEYRYYVMHDRSSIFSNVGRSSYLGNYIWSSEFEPVMDYHHLVPSSNDKYIASVVAGSGITNLVAPDLVQILQFKGVQPDFSPDGKYLLCINGRSVYRYVIDVEEIRRLLYEEKIFGELEVEYKKWITY